LASHDVQRTVQGGERPRLLIEEWLPVQELGIECRREGSVGLHPPPNRLHVWWARRPLTVSRAAVLGSLLPADFPHEKFRRLMGILGDPIAEKKRIDDANKQGIKLSEGFSYKRAFTNLISESDVRTMREAVEKVWGTPSPALLDSFAGGGSIPFEALRLGLPTISNELNPVASVILKATIEYPAKFGSQLASETEKWGKTVAVKLREELGKCFPKKQGEEIFAYIWVRTVKCPECGLVVPLSPNWWLDQEAKLGYRLQLPSDGSNICTFKIARHGEDGFDAEKGTVKGGRGQCPRNRNHTLDEGYIKAEAQAGRMGHQLAAIGYKITRRKGRHFRDVTEMDLEGVRKAEEMLKEKLPEWEAKGWMPTEGFPETSNDPRPLHYGMNRWCDFFSPRQLLVHLTTLEAIKGLPLEEELDPEMAKAARTYLAFAFDKTLDYNSLQSRFAADRVIIKNTFDRHDFAFIWSYGEIDGAGQLWKWALDQIIDAYKGLVELIPNTSKDVQRTFLFGDAASLSSISDKSIPCVVVDPPYSDNVMYAELSDYFYVWMKRLLGDVYPELFRSALTDKDNEAVANLARFRQFKNRKELAEQDYEAKMLAAFRELHRVLQDDGVLTVMFTHKSNTAWSSLGRSLIEAGFEITASWPVRTESEHSLHQAKKVAASSTILLTCRKRRSITGTRGWWEEVKPLLYQEAYSKAKLRYEQGIRGVDLQISTYAPALQVISSRWPVVDSSGVEISPIKAIEEASRAAFDFRMTQLTSPEHRADVDMPTLFYISAFDAFQGRFIPPDEAIKLSHALNVEIDELITKFGVVKKDNKQVTLLTAEERREAGKFDIDGEYSGSITLDKVQAVELVYQDRGVRGVGKLYQEKGFLADPAYVAAFEALLNSLPPSEPEYATLSEVAKYAMKGRIRDRRREDEAGRSGRLDEY
jgi:putative DNA methylase